MAVYEVRLEIDRESEIVTQVHYVEADKLQDVVGYFVVNMVDDSTKISSVCELFTVSATIPNPDRER